MVRLFDSADRVAGGGWQIPRTDSTWDTSPMASVGPSGVAGSSVDWRCIMSDTLETLQDAIPYYPQVTGVHPACLAVPAIGEFEQAILDQSIAEHGLRHEILLTPEGLLVDGRGRLLACFKANMEPRFRKVITDPWQIVHAENIARRHLDIDRQSMFVDAWRQHKQSNPSA